MPRLLAAQLLTTLRRVKTHLWELVARAQAQPGQGVAEGVTEGGHRDKAKPGLDGAGMRVCLQQWNPRPGGSGRDTGTPGNSRVGLGTPPAIATCAQTQSQQGRE